MRKIPSSLIVVVVKMLTKLYGTVISLQYWPQIFTDMISWDHKQHFVGEQTFSERGPNSRQMVDVDQNTVFRPVSTIGKWVFSQCACACALLLLRPAQYQCSTQLASGIFNSQLISSPSVFTSASVDASLQSPALLHRLCPTSTVSAFHSLALA